MLSHSQQPRPVAQCNRSRPTRASRYPALELHHHGPHVSDSLETLSARLGRDLVLRSREARNSIETLGDDIDVLAWPEKVLAKQMLPLRRARELVKETIYRQAFFGARVGFCRSLVVRRRV